MRSRGGKRAYEAEPGEHILAVDLENTLARVPEAEFSESTRHFHNKWQEALAAPQVRVLKEVLAFVQDSGGRLPGGSKSKA